MASLNELWGNLAPSPRRDIKQDTLTEAENQDRHPAMPAPRADNTSSLTIEARDELAALRKQFHDRIKNQLNSGLDPELVAIAPKMGGDLRQGRGAQVPRSDPRDDGGFGNHRSFWRILMR